MEVARNKGIRKGRKPGTTKRKPDRARDWKGGREEGAGKSRTGPDLEDAANLAVKGRSSQHHGRGGRNAALHGQTMAGMQPARELVPLPPTDRPGFIQAIERSTPHTPL